MSTGLASTSSRAGWTFSFSANDVASLLVSEDILRLGEAMSVVDIKKKGARRGTLKKAKYLHGPTHHFIYIPVDSHCSDSPIYENYQYRQLSGHKAEHYLFDDWYFHNVVSTESYPKGPRASFILVQMKTSQGISGRS